MMEWDRGCVSRLWASLSNWSADDAVVEEGGDTSAMALVRKTNQTYLTLLVQFRCVTKRLQ